MMESRTVVVLGGGRWGKVIVETLARCVDGSTPILVRTRHNRGAMREWAAARNLSARVRHIDDLPGAAAGRRDLAVVANAAHEHEPTLDAALSAGYHVLGEKPFTLSHTATRRIRDRADSLHLGCYPSNVLLFAGHLAAFSRSIAAAGALQSLHITWTDPSGEVRHGSAKRYDAGLPVVTDVVPHIASILEVLAPGREAVPVSVSAGRGGARVDLRLDCDGLPVRVDMERNSAARARVIEAATDAGMLTLDFTEEPGTISQSGAEWSADPEWGDKVSPMEAMLRAAMAAIDGEPDARLRMSVALHSACIIDGAMPMYRAAQLRDVRDSLGKFDNADNPDAWYALTEILQAVRRVPESDAARRTRAVLKAMPAWSGCADDEFLRRIHRLAKESHA